MENQEKASRFLKTGHRMNPVGGRYIGADADGIRAADQEGKEVSR